MGGYKGSPRNTQSRLWDRIMGIRRRIKYMNHNLTANEGLKANKIDCPLIQNKTKYFVLRQYD